MAYLPARLPRRKKGRRAPLTLNPLVAADQAKGLPIVIRSFVPAVPFRYRLLRPRGGMRDRLSEVFASTLTECAAALAAAGGG
jgi:hypothetical protein